MKLFDLLAIDKEKIIKKIKIGGVECAIAEFMLANVINFPPVPHDAWEVKKIYQIKDDNSICVEVDY